jgi:hypothetical protein
MAALGVVVRPRQDGFVNSGGPPPATRRLHAGGAQSYTNAPDRRAVGSLRICEETDHEEI